MSDDALVEEFEVLESIYPTELTKLSERDIQIEVEPDDVLEGEDTVRLTLRVHYPETYPDTLPELSLEPFEGSLDDTETNALLDDLRRAGEENLGMAMTFTLVSQLREQLSSLVRSRADRRIKEEREKERLALEAEEARTRGTPVTIQSFRAWKVKFDKEMAEKRAKVEEEKMKSLTPKEREELKRFATRLTGRQLFERNRDLDQDESLLLEEGTVSVDVSQYERERGQEEQEEQEGVEFSDSD